MTSPFFVRGLQFQFQTFPDIFEKLVFFDFLSSDLKCISKLLYLYITYQMYYVSWWVDRWWQDPTTQTITAQITQGLGSTQPKV